MAKSLAEHLASRALGVGRKALGAKAIGRGVFHRRRQQRVVLSMNTIHFINMLLRSRVTHIGSPHAFRRRRRGFSFRR